MRPTWIVLGLVVGLGAVAYVRLRGQGDATPLARTATGGAQPGGAMPGSGDGLAGGDGPAMASGAVASGEPGAGDAGAMGDPSPPLVATPATGPTPSPDEQAAAEVRARIAERRKAGDAAAVEALERRLDTELADTIEARRHAYDRGVAAAREALREDRPLDARIPVADRARRDLSRGLWIPDLFDGAGRPTETRRTAMATIASLNALVFTYRRGLPGVTTTYDVKPGDSPVRIVSREKLPYGPHVLLYWNHGGNLDPSRLRAGETLVLPTEPLEVRVDRAHHLLGLYVGGVLVKELDVGVGKATTPTHPGTYEVKDKYLNPDWHVPPELLQPGQPRVIPYGDPRNELGDAWIPIASAEHPTGYGIHGTTRPDTVGTDCSNGCVRLRNAEAVEMTNWVRTAKGEGQATRVVIR